MLRVRRLMLIVSSEHHIRRSSSIITCDLEVKLVIMWYRCRYSSREEIRSSFARNMPVSSCRGAHSPGVEVFDVGKKSLNALGSKSIQSRGSMYAVFVELADTCVAYSSTHPPSDIVSAGIDGMLCYLLGAGGFVWSPYTFKCSWLTRLYKSSNYVADGGALMAMLSSPVGYKCCSRLSSIITV
jgi:hypothetical protein